MHVYAQVLLHAEGICGCQRLTHRCISQSSISFLNQDAASPQHLPFSIASPTCSTRVTGTCHHILNFCEHQGSKLRSSFLCSQHFTQWVLPNPNLKYFNLVWLTWRGNRNIYLHIFFVWTFLWVRNLLLSVLIILWMNASYRC